MAGEFGFLEELGDLTGSVGVGNFDVGTMLPVQSEWADIAGKSGGGFWGNLQDVASKVGGGATDFLSGAGSLAKGLAPFAGMGTGIMGLIAQRQAANRIAKQQPIMDRAQTAQIQNAEQARPYAAATAELAPKIADLAPQAAAFSPQVAAVAPKLDAVATKIASQTGQPVVDFATQTLKQAQAGEIPDPYKAKIEAWRSAAKAKVLDFLARSGQADSSARVQLEAWVDQQAEAMGADILGQEQDRALAAFDQGRGAYTSEASVLGQEANVLGAATQPLDVAAGILSRAGQDYGTAGSILTGSSGSANQVAQRAADEEKTLEELIAESNRNIARVAAGAA